MDNFDQSLKNFFAVIAKGQSYLNMLYLVLSFPLGLAYFIFLVVGLSLGVSLMIVWVGFILLLVVFAGWWGMAAFERQLTINMLHEPVAPMNRVNLNGLTFWQKVKAVAANPVTWKSLAYLLVKFPLGILNFSVAITAIAVSLSLLAAPFIYRYLPYQITFDFNRVIFINTLGEALILFAAGAVIALLSMHLMNALAWVNAKFARVMLGSGAAKPAALNVNPVQLESEPVSQV